MGIDINELKEAQKIIDCLSSSLTKTFGAGFPVNIVEDINFVWNAIENVIDNEEFIKNHDK